MIETINKLVRTSRQLVQEFGREPTPEEATISPSDAAINNRLADRTRAVLKSLTPREEEVIRMRFGIGRKSDQTLEEIGDGFEVTRECIPSSTIASLRWAVTTSTP